MINGNTYSSVYNYTQTIYSSSNMFIIYSLYNRQLEFPNDYNPHNFYIYIMMNLLFLVSKLSKVK